MFLKIFPLYYSQQKIENLNSRIDVCEEYNG